MNKCLGCGIKMQNHNKEELGYVENLENDVCERCFRLKNYGEYKKVTLKNEDFNQILDTIPQESLVIYIADALNLDLSYIKNFKNIILVITKRDILSKSVKDEKIINKLKETYPMLLEIIMISSLKNYGLDKLYNSMLKYHNNKKIYFVGSTNSGKSTLLNKLITNYDEQQTKSNITMSMYPSTTIDKIELKLNKMTIVDTPGLLDDGNLTTYLEKKELKKVMPKKEIKPRSCQIKGHGSILIDNYARIDYKTKEDNSLVIYTSTDIKIRFSSYEKNTYRDFIPHKYFIPNEKDIVIPGLGFIKFTKSLEVTIYLPEKITPHLRDNLI